MSIACRGKPLRGSTVVNGPTHADLAARPDGKGPPARQAELRLIERTILLLLVLGLAAGVVFVLLPFVTPLLFAAVLAIATWPLRKALVRRARLSPGLSATVLVLGCLVLIGLPMLAVASRLPTRVAEIGQGLEATLATVSGAPPAWVAGIPIAGERAAGLWREVAQAGGDIPTLAAPYADPLRQGALAVAAAMADSVLQVLLSLLIAGMFWARGDALAASLRDAAARLGGGAGTGALDAAGGALRSVAYGVVGTACIQGVLMGVGAWIAGVPGAPALGFVVFLLAISQIGAILLPVVWGGAAWWLFRQDAQVWGAFMVVWGLLLVTGIDNVLLPWLISRGVAMPMTLVILGVFGGFVSLGFLGLFVGPALLAVAYTLGQAWRASAPEDEAAA